MDMCVRERSPALHKHHVNIHYNQTITLVLMVAHRIYGLGSGLGAKGGRSEEELGGGSGGVRRGGVEKKGKIRMGEWRSEEGLGGRSGGVRRGGVEKKGKIRMGE
ncbi:hypothetical protein Pcinc_038044 [Petrolisthes cinctipes]|uniref:Uncharacterized protein n=1 Tax=Petrolisthes cinctipes TaxID=88211 RepID=A0AAE1EKF3_PETCI|nr:hypothetical protein Pcinc_038044 [Petrolisthes cinctipes]